MRVTGGILRGRQVVVPKGDQVRPTQDRVRLALFSSLGTCVERCRFLDVFAGSGAVGLEAWSRGAAAVWWVEADRAVYSVLAENVHRLCGGPERGRGRPDRSGEAAPEARPPDAGGETRLIRSDALGFLEKTDREERFDLVFADPPYDREGNRSWPGRLLAAMDNHRVLAERGTVILEQGTQDPLVVPAGWRVRWDRTYGETRLLSFARDPEAR